MRCMYASAALLVLLSMSTGLKAASITCDWHVWQRLPVQDQGRYKPLDTLARETLQAIAQRETLRDPQSAATLDSVAVYLTMLFDWQGWDNGSLENVMSDEASARLYFAGHETDKWDRLRIFPVEDRTLRSKLGLPVDQHRISAIELCQAEIADARTGAPVPFLKWAEAVAGDAAIPASGLAASARQLVTRLNQYMAHRTGQGLRVLPASEDGLQPWLSVRQLWCMRFDDQTDPTGNLRQAQRQLRKLHAAYRQGAVQPFNDRAQQFVRFLSHAGPELGPYASRGRIRAELAYNNWVPIRLALLATSCSLVLLMLGARGGRPKLYALGVALLLAGLTAAMAGLGARAFITQRAPVTNMYESLVFTSLAVGLLGLAIGWRYSSAGAVVAAAAVTAVMLLLAELSPASMDQGLRPLPPSLRSNFWLITHVLIITLSYASFGLALGIGNVTLGYFVVRSGNAERIDGLTKMNCQCLRIGAALLALGTVTGGLWAESSWGRFWGWDPKEVWALITLLGYLAVLHARHVGWVGQFGLAALSVICFGLVVVAWYGVNFVMGAGLHSYGRGSGGEELVLGMLLVQFTYVALAAVRSVGLEHT